MSQPVTPDLVRALARRARLGVRDDEVEALARDLGGVLGYVERLRRVDLRGVEPMTHPASITDRTARDEPGATLPAAALAAMAPDSQDGFVRLPKVLGDGGGA